MSTLQAVQLLKQKKRKQKKGEMLMSEWRKISRCAPGPKKTAIGEGSRGRHTGGMSS